MRRIDQPDAIKLGNEHAQARIYTVVQRFGDTAGNFFGMYRKEQTAAKFRYEL